MDRLAPLTDSILVEATHQPQFPCSKVSRKTGSVNGEWIVLRVKQNMFSEFNEAAQPKTSLAKYSIEFNDLAVQTRPHGIAFLRLLGRPYCMW